MPQTSPSPGGPGLPAHSSGSWLRGWRWSRVWHRWLTGALGLALLAGAGLLLSAWLAPLPARLHTPGSVEVDYRDGSVAHVFLAPDERWRLPTTLDEVDPRMVEALIRYEDKRFWFHPGVDPIALLRAVWINLSSGHIQTGASTLSMQVVRVLEPRPRTLRSKLIEMHRALSLELHLSKAQILEAYLSFAPYGRNIEGVQAGSLAILGHRADALTDDEIALLLAIPQRPGARLPSPDHAPALEAARAEILAFLIAAEVFQTQPVTLPPVPTALRPFPREAPHAARWLVDQQPSAVRIHSTLDRGSQQLAERTVARYRAQRARQGIYNTAAVVLDPHTGELLALVGGFDFWDDDHGGQIVAFDNPRSPGSALKPFLYAAAIDRGLALPGYLVPDVPRAWGTYAPTNYDGHFEGLVRLEDALSRSLNLPFIDLLQQLGVDAFLGELQAMGVDSLSQDPGHYGLSAAVGGIEISPLQLAGLYGMLANEGVAQLPHASQRPARQGLRLRSPGASWLTARALRLRDRADFPSRGALSSNPRHIAWKTGTSFGHRDAWAAGFNAQRVAVIWMGNLDNQGAKDLVGSQAAGPVLFDLLEALSAQPKAPAGPPDDLITVDVCTLSGHLPGAACPRTRSALARRTHVPTEPCPLHVQVEVDRASGLVVGPGCRSGPSDTQAFVRWPAPVRRWLSDLHGDLPSVPDLAPGCAPEQTQAPVIRSPEAGQTSVLIPGIATSDQEIPLEADAAGDISWFVDGRYLGTVPARQRLWWTPQAGVHQLVATDATGRSSRRTLRVERAPSHRGSAGWRPRPGE